MKRKYLSDDGLSLYSDSKKEDIQIGTSRGWGGFFDLDFVDCNSYSVGA